MTQPIVIEHAHSELGPSASERWLNCPGSVPLIRGLPNGSRYAAEGNAAHTVSEWCRKQRKPASAFRGRVLKVDEYEFVVGKSMIESVDTFCAYVAKLPGIPFFEKRVYYTPWVPKGFGTLDDGRLSNRLCYITDFKHGKGVRVFATNNTQLMLYALGMYYGYWHLFDFERFVLTVVQPRMGNHIDVWEISLDDLLHWADSVAKPIAAQTLLPGAPMKAGSWCQFCPRKRVCRTLLESELGVTRGRRFATVDVAQEFENLESNDE